MSETKALSGLKITDAAKGEVEAVFATLGVIDHDGDVTVKGAFLEEDVRISAYNHESWKSALPVGKGTIREEGDKAIFKGRFFLDTTAGRDTFEVVKEMGELQEWSYGYDTLESEPGTKDGRTVNFIKRQKVHEVSPVILGAGIDTGTVAVKAAKQLQSDLLRRVREAGRDRWGNARTWVYVDDLEIDEDWAVFCIWTEDDAYRLVRVAYSRDAAGAVTLAEEEEDVEITTDYAPVTKQKLSDHLATVLADAKTAAERLAEVKALREKRGKALGQESADNAAELIDELETLTKTLREVLTSADDNEQPEPKSAEDGALGLDDEALAAEAAARLQL